MLLGEIETRKMTDVEVASIKTELDALVNQGLIDGELLSGYYEYLETFGLDVPVRLVKSK
jgi:hypothetical protein